MFLSDFADAFSDSILLLLRFSSGLPFMGKEETRLFENLPSKISVCSHKDLKKSKNAIKLRI